MELFASQKNNLLSSRPLLRQQLRQGYAGQEGYEEQAKRRTSSTWPDGRSPEHSGRRLFEMT